VRPIPQPDETTRFFWEAAARHQLVLQQCMACGRLQYPPDVACICCQYQGFKLVEVSGRGTLYSFASVDRTFHAAFVAHVPYVVGLIELAEQPGLRIFANVVEAAAEQLSIGTPMEVTFEEREGTTLPQFRPLKVAT
jgi:uncharacterized protein